MPSESLTPLARFQPAAIEEISIALDDNRAAGLVFGEFDQNLAQLEKRLGIEAIARGNEVLLRGSAEACLHGRQAIEHLYDRALKGADLDPGDVDGAIRLTAEAAGQLLLPTIEPKARRNFSQIGTRKRMVLARTANQDAYMRAMKAHELVFGVGPAGTGKTYLAVAYAAQLLESGEISRIILSRPAVEAGERLGFLPGDMREKVDPYLRPLYDALYDMMPPERVERGLQSGMIEIAPLAFMRGRTLADAAIILDEAQNTTSMQMKMFLTRLGENSRMIVTGDPSQVDLPEGQRSGLAEALRILDGVEGIARIRFGQADVVRHELVARIVGAYESEGASRNADRAS